MSESNAMCDGSGPCVPGGRVRLLPLGSIPDHGNVILCRACFERELQYRRERNMELGADCQFELPAWADCAIYGEQASPSAQV